MTPRLEVSQFDDGRIERGRREEDGSSRRETGAGNHGVWMRARQCLRAAHFSRSKPKRETSISSAVRQPTSGEA